MVKSGMLTKGDICGSAIFDGRKWYHRYKEIRDGKIRYGRKVGFSTADEANASYEQFRTAFEKEARKAGMATRLDGTMTFLEYLQYFLEEILASFCALSTYTVYSWSLYKHIIPCSIEDIELYRLNEEYLEELLNRVGALSKSSKNKAYELIRLALKQAVKEKRISSIPLVPSCKRLKPEITILNKEQIKTLLQSACTTDWYLEILLALFVGCRKGEILGLKYNDCSCENETITIDRQIGMEKVNVSDGNEVAVKVEKPPKSEESRRTIYAPSIVCEEIVQRHKKNLANQKQCKDGYSDNGYLSCQKNGEPRGITSINDALGKICKKCGLPQITVHSLRHCYASILLEQGYDLELVSGMLGHSSYNTTFEYYVDIMDEDVEIKTYLNDLYPVEG